MQLSIKCNPRSSSLESFDRTPAPTPPSPVGSALKKIFHLFRLKNISYVAWLPHQRRNNKPGPLLHSLTQLTQLTLVRLLRSASSEQESGEEERKEAQRSRSVRLKKDQMSVNLLKGDINMICPILPPPPARLNLEESELIRNVLKSQRREERGDHTVLMNRDGGISSNLRLHLHLIYPSCIHQPPPPPSPPPHPYTLPFPPFICLCFLSANFVSLSAPFCLSAAICLFPPPTNSLIVWFLSPIFHFHPLPNPHSNLPQPPPPAVEQCQRSIRQLCSAWRGWRPWRRAALRVSRRQHHSSVRSLLN